MRPRILPFLAVSTSLAAALGLSCKSLEGLTGSLPQENDGAPANVVGVGSGDGGTTDCSPDLGSDPENCGRCGHDCLGGGCVAGRCQPVQIVDDDGYGVAVDETHVFYATGTEIRRALKDGTDNMIVAAVHTTGNVVLALDAGYVYFVTKSFGQNVHRVAKTGGAVERCSDDDLTSSSPIAVDGMAAYWRYPGTGIHRVPKTACGVDAGAAGSVLAGSDAGGAMALGGGHVHWSELGRIGRVAVDGGVPVFVDAELPRALDADDVHVVWRTDEGEIVSLAYAQAGGTAERVADRQYHTVDTRGVVLDGTTIYWSSYNQAGVGAIRSCSIEGCANRPETLAETQDVPLSLAQDATALYWYDYANGIMRLAK